MARPKIGVIGCGSIGKRHTKNLLAIGACTPSELVAFDLAAGARAEVEALGVATVDTLDALLDLAPELVVVASPTSKHVEHAIAAAERGCHLFVEKPVAERHDGELDRLIAIVEEKRLVTLVGCNLRFHPGLRRIKAMLAEGRIGRVVMARVQFGYWLADWRPNTDYRTGYGAHKAMGGGVILDAIHELDYVRWLMGEVTSVAAFADHLSPKLEIDTEDSAAIILRFASGALGEVHLDYVQRAYTRNCWLVGDGGTLAWDYPSPEVRLFDPKTKAWEVSSSVPSWDPNDMYLDEARHLAACLTGKEESEQTIADGARVLDLAIAAKDSAAKTVFVDLPRS